MIIIIGTSHLTNPYIFHAKGDSLTHKRRIAQRHYDYVNGVYLDITVANHK
jgi:hypothetical protein